MVVKNKEYLYSCVCNYNDIKSPNPKNNSLLIGCYYVIK